MSLSEKAQELRDEHGYWGEHPDHPVDVWQHEVSNDETRQGYWEWVAARIENEATDEEGWDAGD